MPSSYNTFIPVSGAKAPRKTVSTPTRSVSDSSDGKSKFQLIDLEYKLYVTTLCY